jgi:hypothetical protein
MADVHRCLSRLFARLDQVSVADSCGVAVVVDRSMLVVIGQVENRWSVDSVAAPEQRVHAVIAGHPFFRRFSAVLSLSCNSIHRKKRTLGGACVFHSCRNCGWGMPGLLQILYIELAENSWFGVHFHSTIP